MDDPATVDKLLDARLRALQIIRAALIAGVVVFAGVVLFSPANNPGPPPERQGPLVTYVALGVFVAALLAWAIVPNLIAGRAVAKNAAGTWTAQSGPGAPPAAFATDGGKLLVVYQNRSIIAAALLDGPAFLAGVAYMTERQAAALGVTAGAVLLMLITFPTRGGVQAWLERQQQTIDTTRQFGEMRT